MTQSRRESRPPACDNQIFARHHAGIAKDARCRWTEFEAVAGIQHMLGLAFHPDYAENGRFFALYSRADGDGATSISEFTVGDDAPVADTERTLLVIPSSSTMHKGGMLAFDHEGTCYTMSGNGALVVTPEVLFTVDLTDASTTFVTSALASGGGGHALGFNPDNRLLYHFAGDGVPNVDEFFETYNPQTGTVTNIPLGGVNPLGLLSLAYAGNDLFYAGGGD